MAKSRAAAAMISARRSARYCSETRGSDRDVYGAIDLSAGAPQVLTASAGSATIAQTLQGVATSLSQAQTQGAAPAVAVRDVVALPVEDRRGAGLTAAAFPLILGGMLAAVLLINLVRGRVRRTAGAFAFAVTGGLAMAAILQFWLGSLDGAYLANAGAIALTVAASSMTIMGLESLLGYAGFGIGSVIMMLVGNPLSGISTAPELLPGWSGPLGQLLPPGAGGHLLRSTAYFGGHGEAQPIIVLVAWLALGAMLSLLGHHRSRRAAAGAPADETTARPAPYATV
ncbi:ABC transporter permease [Actinoplanes sp. Pm04-4]|uniref:ABC transporter permease n=1 Tax=Paractinoplanes pyxinae TaxID=2997416 RepID=A0ABT4BAY3_9ACTN|nr:ABC transporter permease [Actinoplanes pyxinae]MCY1143675.1 ABC transporter permease [Actinoplanes pyxinae]